MTADGRRDPPQQPGDSSGLTGERLPSGEDRLREALRRRRLRARIEAPRPYDDDWGWWIEQRLTRLEQGQRWLLGLALSTLAAELIRVIVRLFEAPGQFAP